MAQLPPQEQMNRLLTGYWISQALYVAAKLGLADLVKEAPRRADELAGATRTHAPSLYRLLRALASVGVFVEGSDQRFSLTPLAECLRSDVPGSQRSLAIMCGEEHYRSLGELLYSVETGKTAFDKVYRTPVFEFLARTRIRPGSSTRQWSACTVEKRPPCWRYTISPRSACWPTSVAATAAC